MRRGATCHTHARMHAHAHAQVILGPAAHPSTCAATRPYSFAAPAAGAEWHWGFYSCNGFHEAAKEAAYGGIGALWRHVLGVHATRPLHVMVGGEWAWRDGGGRGGGGAGALCCWARRSGRDRCPSTISHAACPMQHAWGRWQNRIIQRCARACMGLTVWCLVHIIPTASPACVHAGGDQLYNDDVWEGPVLSAWMVKDDQAGVSGALRRCMHAW